MAAKSEVTLEDVAAELYALPPKDFTEARNARAKQLSDASLAAQVRALRKPVLAAWVVNLFAREQTAELGEALELAGDLRDAQADLDAAALTTLNRQRRALVRGLAQQASALAGSRGENITASTADAVEQTLNAAMYQVEAAAAVASGRLFRPLDAGDEPAAAEEAVAGSLGDLVTASATEPSAARPADEVKARRERKAAEGELRAAQADATKAQRELDQLERARTKVDDQIDGLADRLKELEDEIARTQKELDRTTGEGEALDETLTESRQHAEETQRAAAAAQKALDRIRRTHHG